MKAFHELLKPNKTTPHRGYVWQPCEGTTDEHGQPVAGVLRIDTDRDSKRYAVIEFTPGSLGRAFRFAKLDPVGAGEDRGYAVFVCGRNDRSHLCECRGHQRFGTCRHVECVASLIANGQL